MQMTTFSRLPRRFLLWVAAVSPIGTLACKYQRQEPAARQPVGEFDVPGYDLTADPLKDGAPSGTRRYTGSIVLFSPDISPDGLGPLVDAARMTRLKKAAWLDYQKAEVAPRAALVVALKKERTDVDALASAGAAVAEARRAAAWGWFEQRLTDLRPLMAPDDATTARAIFAAYCEAKIWELATNAKTLGANYIRRPVPLAACEPILTAAGFFSGAPCDDATGAEKLAGKSYATCLWREGVFKTRFFSGRYDTSLASEPGVSKAAKLAAWLDDGTLTTILTSSRGPRAVEAAMSQDKARLGSVFGTAYKEIFLPIGGAPAGRADQATLTPSDASPAMLIAAIEDGTATGPGGTPPLLQMPLPSAAGQAFADDVKSFASRIAGDPPVNDFLFSAAMPPWPEPVSLAVVKAKPSYTGVFAVTDPAFAPRLKALDAAILAADADQHATDAEDAALFSAYAAALTDGAAKASATDVSEAFWVNSSLVITPVASGAWQAAFKLDDASTEAVEIDTADGAHDPATGSLTFKTSLSKPENFGFMLAGPPRGPGEPFSLLSSDDVGGAALTLEVWPNKIDDALGFYSGTITLDTRAGTHYEGGVNLLGDQ